MSHTAEATWPVRASRHALIGVAMEQIEVEGLRIAYERVGHGPPLVLLHGFVGDGRSTWQRQIDDLSDDFTVIAWDAPGAGRSSDPPESFRMSDYADCLAGFVATLGVGRPHVAGISFGGALALELYRRHTTLPATLILAGAYAGWAGSLASGRRRTTPGAMPAVVPIGAGGVRGHDAPVDVLEIGTEGNGSMISRRRWRSSIPSDSAPWHSRRRTPICATCSPASTCRRSCCAATRTCERR